MAEDAAPRKKDEEAGAGWIMTFADLMSLLMCFFVLLLSFAELDIMKFKAIAGSLKLAFGVQREIKAIEVPKGTSIVAQEFSAGKPEPTIINEVRQQTTDEDKQSLEFTDALVNDPDGSSATESDGGGTLSEEQALQEAARLVAALQDEVDKGMIEVETEGASIVIRIREKGSFPSGAARFDPAFAPVIEKLRDSLADIPGRIVVAGHTDDVPIHTQLYRSNWDLSSARAVTVVHALLKGSALDPARLVVEGHGEAHPLVANDTAQNRALNRRVEIVIRQDAERDAPPADPAAYSGVLPAPAVPATQPAAAGAPDWIPGATVPDWVPRAPDAEAVTTGAAAAPDPAAAEEADAPMSRIDHIRTGIAGG
ncbi:MAG: flagellar motor protein MotB [Gammaproteobacteria bacterium]